jgi:anti-anti-sigma regulatory factor
MSISAEVTTLALPAIVDLDALDRVRDRLVDSVEHGPVDIDASGVERVSTNALFMLISAAETARRNSFSLKIREPSGSMRAAIERLGLNATFSGLMKG